MNQRTTSRVVPLRFDSFNIQQGSKPEATRIHLPGLPFGVPLDQARKREGCGYRAVVLQVERRAGLPFFGVVRNSAIALELERTQFVQLVEVLRTKGSVAIDLTLNEREEIVAVAIEPKQHLCDSQVQGRTGSD